jgi:hypothetical protein
MESCYLNTLRPHSGQKDFFKVNYHGSGKTQMQTLEVTKCITSTGAGKTTGQGQAEVSNPDRV